MEFELLRHQRYSTEERIRFCDNCGLVREIPLSWTSAAPEDPFLSLAQSRSWFRFNDLVELAGLVKELKRDV